MRIHKKYIAIYITLTLVLLLMMNSYITSSRMYQAKTGKIDSNYRLLNEYVEKAGPEKELLLVIGNSYVNASFRPQDLEGNRNNNIIQFIVSGLPMVDMVGIVEHLPEDTSITSLLVGLGYNYANPVGGSSTAYEKYFTGNPARALWASIPLVRGHSMSTTILKEDMKCLLSRFASLTCKNADDVEDVEMKDNDVSIRIDPEAHINYLRKSTMERYKEYIPFTSSVSEGFRLNLERLKSACEQRGIKLYAYTAPVYRGLRDKLSPEVLDKFRETVQSAGILYADLNMVFSGWNATLFSDATHVDAVSGGRITTLHILDFTGIDKPHKIQAD